MNTMTCREMGGSCYMLISGNTVQEMMNNGIMHIMETNDEGHRKALAIMEEMKKYPEMAKKWIEQLESKFNALSAY